MDTMYPAKINSPATTLASGINDIVTTIPLTNASVVPAAPNLAVIGTGEDAETVLYTGKSGNDLTGCTRGFQGTAKAWESGTSVARFFTAYDYDTLRTNLSTHDETETPGIHGSTTANTASKLVHRDTAGRAMISDPAVDTHIDNQGARDAAISTHAGLTTGVHGAGANTLWHGGLTNIVDKTHLSQDFGASATRLRNLILTPITGEIIRELGTGISAFSASINGTPTTTSVVYDTETNEGDLTGIQSGANYWGRRILHNTTRGNSRKIVSVNVATNTITTEASTDDWADNDVITTQSQTNTMAGYCDIDLSAEIPSTVTAIQVFIFLDNNESTLDNTRYIMIHPFMAYDFGYRQWLNCNVPDLKTQGTYFLQVHSQKMTYWKAGGCDDIGIGIKVVATVEYADT